MFVYEKIAVMGIETTVVYKIMIMMIEKFHVVG